MLLHPLTNFEIQRYYQNEPKFNGTYSRNNLLKIKDWICLVNPDECKSVRTHCIAIKLWSLKIHRQQTYYNKHI